jgi:hypothetical protein
METSEDKVIGTLRIIVKPLIICITILILLFKISNTIKDVAEISNTTTIRTNYTVITNVKFLVDDSSIFNKPPYTLK